MRTQENLEFDFGASFRGLPEIPQPNLSASERVLDPAPIDFQKPLPEQLREFHEFGKATQCLQTAARTASGGSVQVDTYVNEFWTSKQRAAHSLHEISYRACFKPQLPRFFIERLTAPGDVVYDPFMGRGTTVIEAALLGRIPFGCDINPLSQFLVRPRLNPPGLAEIQARLNAIDFETHDEFPEELLVFYHPETLREICALKKYLLERQSRGELDSIDQWIWLIALNRLTGHSAGFFSVYTLPPNQAVSIQSQRKINKNRDQTPPRREVRKIILKKSRILLSDADGATLERLAQIREQARFWTQDAGSTRDIPAERVSLAVTSPPFLNVVDYATDNWLRCWFIGIDAKSVKLTIPKKLELWQTAMTGVFRELHRVLRRGGHVAFEVGEISRGEVKLEQAVVPCGLEAGLQPVLILINDQIFTKTANCWGVDNHSKGTNTNRIVLFRKS